MRLEEQRPWVALACGGTGGHLFPGLAVAESLWRGGVEVTLLISQKEVDAVATRGAGGMKVAVLPAVGLTRGRLGSFCAGFVRSLGASLRLFRERPPQAVLAMGSFTSAPPVLAGKAGGAATFLHESNTIPGRANRWLAQIVDEAFVGFPSAARRLRNPNVTVTGTPVRSQFRPAAKPASRMALGLQADRPVVLVTGGSQGARGINELMLAAWPEILRAVPEAQLLHLAGLNEAGPVRQAYERSGLRAVVHPFLTEMELALGAATVVVSRAGASSLAELAAVGVPAVLVPYPSAVANHQYWNARAYVDAGAACLLEEKGATGPTLAALVSGLLRDETAQATMRAALARWESPGAAERVAERIVAVVMPGGRAPSAEVTNGGVAPWRRSQPGRVLS